MFSQGHTRARGLIYKKIFAHPSSILACALPVKLRTTIFSFPVPSLIIYISVSFFTQISGKQFVYYTDKEISSSRKYLPLVWILVSMGITVCFFSYYGKVGRTKL